MQIRQVTTYLGHVQGVGFRWTVSRTAADFAVVGWVRNCPDGSVEVAAEGEKAEVLAFLQEIDSSMRGQIRSKTGYQSPALGDLHRFEIRY